MGYRSDVVIGIAKTVWVEHQLSPSIPDALFSSDVEMHTKENAVYFVIRDWKWYPSYPEVQAIESWLDDLPMEDFGAMRIGENDDDIETWGQPGDYEIWLSRSIDFPT